MSRIFVVIFLSFTFFWSLGIIGINGVFANAQDTVNGTFNSTSTQTVIVTEPSPGLQCSCIDKNNCTDVSTRKYSCVIPPGLSGLQGMLGAIIRTAVYIIMLLGVLALVGIGIMWGMSGSDGEKVKHLKGQFIGVIIGLIILFMFRYILAFLAPWIYQ